MFISWRDRIAHPRRARPEPSAASCVAAPMLLRRFKFVLMIVVIVVVVIMACWLAWFAWELVID